MHRLSRRTFLGLTAQAAAALWLTACGGTKIEDETSGTTEAPADSTAPGYITASGTLITPYDEGYSTGVHHAVIEVEDYGTIAVELDADTAPITVSNFAHLVNEGFYNGLTFHRIISGFMVQGGDPRGDGTGGSDVQILGEFSANGKTNDIKHVRGVISMARSQDYNSASSQFFIMHGDADFLDGQYAAFGQVTEGMDVVDKLAEVAVEDDNGTVAPENQPHIASIAMKD